MVYAVREHRHIVNDHVASLPHKVTGATNPDETKRVADVWDLRPKAIASLYLCHRNFLLGNAAAPAYSQPSCLGKITGRLTRPMSCHRPWLMRLLALSLFN